MNTILIQALALGLTLSQILTQPKVQPHFDVQKDRAQILDMMQQGCTSVRAVLTKEIPEFADLDPEALLEQQIENAKELKQSQEALPGLTFSDLKSAYLLFCKGEMNGISDLQLQSVIAFYNEALTALPDPAQLKDFKLPEYSHIVDGKGAPYTDVYRASRRHNLPLAEIPTRVQQAFIAAEDKRFYEHHGVDAAGVLRASVNNLTKSDTRRDQGASTITQQLVKNLLVGDQRSYRRKMREMVVAAELEQQVSKQRILELYLNMVYLGRSAWGVDLAAQAWFAKPLSELSVVECAFLASLPKGPKYYSPDVSRARSTERVHYVLDQMHVDGFINDDEFKTAEAALPQLTFAGRVSSASGSGRFAVDEMVFTIRHQLHLDPKSESLQIRSTIDREIQASTEASVQEGLFQYEARFGRAEFKGPLGSIALRVKGNPAQGRPGQDWTTALGQFNAPEDVHWPVAVILEKDKRGLMVGLTDGTMVRLGGAYGRNVARLNVYDVIFVSLNANRTQANLRFPPAVQGAAMVVENQTGRILALVGGFSHALSQQDRAIHMVRQPGSTVKPLTYLAALQSGLQPDTMVEDAPISLGSENWSPDNYESEQGSSVVTMTNGLTYSKNRVTARLLTLMDERPENALRKVLDLMGECGIHDRIMPHWSAILGGIDVSMLNVATCFAALANGGYRPELHLVDEVKSGDRVIYTGPDTRTKMLGADAASFFQLRTMMQGVVARGTAAGLNQDLRDVVRAADPKSQLSDYMAGKTGTSQEALDAWFVGYTHDLTIAVWTGYDNASLKTRKSTGATGGVVSAPIFGQILRGTLASYPLQRLAPPPAEAARLLYPVRTGEGVQFMRVAANGKTMDTRNKFFRATPPKPKHKKKRPVPEDDGTVTTTTTTYSTDPYNNY